MADEGPIQFVLDLDAEDFIKSGNTALEVIGKIGDPENLAGLISSLGSAVEVLGAVGLAVEAFKVGLDMTVEGEHIQQIENQFKALTTEAGISTETLKKGLIDAAGGLVSTNDLLASANKALVQLGPSATSLPQVMTLARQSVALFGGDVKTTFDEMVVALENGNKRWLQHHGIVLDTNAALRMYADQNGITVDVLSEAGKKQALFNSGLEAAQSRFAGVSTEMGQTTTALAAFKAAWAELVEFLDVAVAKRLGPMFASLFGGIKSGLHGLTLWMKSEFGKGAEQSAASLDLLNSRITDTKKHIEELQEHKGRGAGIDAATAKIQIEQLQLSLKNYEGQLDGLQKKKDQDAVKEEANSQKAIAGDKTRAKEKTTDDALVAAHKAKVDQEILKAEQAVAKAEVANLKNVDAVDAELTKQKNLRATQHDDALKKIAADRKKRILDEGEAAKLTALETRRYEQQEMAQQRLDAAERIKLLQQMQLNSKTTWDGFANEAKVSSIKAKQDLADVATQGKKAFDGLSKAGVSSFEGIGAAMVQNQNVAQAAADAMKKAFLGFLGDTAESYGEMLLLEGIWPPNPLALGAGAALLALGGALKALAGGGGSSVSTGGAGGGGGGAGVVTPATTATTASTQASTTSLAAQQQVQRTVNINIAGHYLNSQESSRTLMEIMRNETDASGFQYNKIGT